MGQSHFYYPCPTVPLLPPFVPLSSINHKVDDSEKSAIVTARLGGRELTLLCSFHQYRIETIVDSCTLMYYSLKLGGGGNAPPMLKLGGGGAAAPPAPPVKPPLSVWDLSKSSRCYTCSLPHNMQLSHICNASKHQQNRTAVSRSLTILPN